MIRRLWPILFLVLLPLLFQAQTPTKGISTGEYFWDTDPGLGNGTAFFATDGTFDETVEALLATGIVPPATNGPHTLSARVLDVDGQWGSLFTMVVERFGITTTHRLPGLMAAEYFWDADPGQGSGTALLALDGNLDEMVESLFENGILMPPAAGPHLFSVRVQDDQNAWSPVFTTMVYNDPTGSTLRTPKITLAEYFWDTDPGLGLADPILAFDGNFDETVERLLNTGVIVPAAMGGHTFHLRVLDSDLQWSTVFTTTVFRDTLTGSVRSVSVAQAEYFWDVDPGIGAANPILATDGNLNESVEALLNNAIIMPSLIGPHIFNLRVKDVDGNWGSIFSTTVYRDSIINGTRPVQVMAGEYYWDVDPGTGAANPLIAFDGNFNESVEKLLDAAVIMPSLNGPHTFNARVKGVDGNWTPLFTTAVYRDSIIVGHRPVRVSQAEYFWNADPGLGAGTPLLALDGNFNESVEKVFSNGISISALPAGNNLFNVRIMDVDGQWGPVFSTVVNTSAPNFGQDTIMGHNAFCGMVPVTGVPYYVDTIGGNDYTWAANNGTILSGQGSDTIYVQWNTTGPWSLTVEGCNPQLLCDTLFLQIDTLPLPTVNAGSDVAICPGGNTLLTATSGGSVNFSWTPGAGLSSTTIANPVANPSVTTLYTVTATDVNGCQETDDVLVTVNPPAIANAGPDTLICRGSSAQLNATGGVSYAWTPATGLNSTTIANPIASPLTNTTYTVVVTDGDGCTASDAVLVSVSNGPNVDAGVNLSICIGDTAQLNGTGAIGYLWSPALTLTSATISNPRAFPLATTQYYLTGTDVYGCTRTDSMTVVVNALPNVQASANTTICSGQSATISATGATNYVWSPTTGLNNPNIASPVASPTTTTTYTVLGTNANGCKDTADVVVTVNPLPTVFAGLDDTICAGDTLQLLANGAVIYNWTPSTGLSATNIANPSAVPPFTITYTVTGTDGNGCVNTDQVEVVVEICTNNTIARNVRQAEYFWDADPGQGLGIALFALDGAFDETVEKLIRNGINIPSGNGAHSFNVRVREQAGSWGPVFTTMVFNDTLTATTRDVQVTEAEYFWDTDPGQGAGTPMIAFDGAFGESVEKVLATNAGIPSAGAHLFSVRVKDVDGNWGPVFTNVVYQDTLNTNARAVAVVQAEYFWDVDPGQGAGTAMLALDGNLDEVVEALLNNPINMPAIAGAHTFGVRVKDVDGNWGSVFSMIVVRENNTVTVRDVKIVQAEYFWDVDPGQGAGTAMLALDGNLDEAVEALLNNPITMPATAGAHSFGVRVKDVDGNWGSVFTMMVVRENITVGNRDVKLAQAEYFWDVDPGQGAGTPLLAVDGAIDETVEAFLNNPVNMPAVIGAHSFNVRVKDINNTWGPLFTTMVYHDSITVGTRILRITQAEYFWDADPGQGAGTPMLAVDGNLDEAIEAVFASGIQVPLPLGPHRFRVRVKEINNTWSQVFTMMVDRDSITATTRDIHLTAAEYFWNTDPGQGSGTPMLSVDGSFDEVVESLRSTINVSNLLPGPNVLGVRVKDFNNVWSNPFKIVLVIDSVLVTVPEEMQGPTVFCQEVPATPVGYAVDTIGTQTYTWITENGTILNGQGSDSITVQWAATGPYLIKLVVCGNGICDTTYQGILVVPNPTIVAVPDTAYFCAGQSVQLTASGGVAFIWTPSAGLSDDDIPNPIASPVTSTQYIVRGTDNFGCHGYDTVYVSLDSGSVVSAGSNVTICVGDTTQLSASGGITYQWSPATGLSDPNIANPEAFPTVTTTYTVIVGTGGGCNSSAQVTVFMDNVAPTITCPANITTNNDPGICGAVINYSLPTGADNCPGYSISLSSGLGTGSTFPVGFTTETYVVTDAAGNADSCSFNISVSENEAPTITNCPANMVVQTDPGVCSAVVTWTLPIIMDNCPGVSVSNNYTPGTTFPLGTRAVHYFVIDNAFQSATCSFTITVQDTVKPVITCPASISVNNDPGICGATVTFANATASDNCSISSVQLTAGLGSGSVFPVGTTTQSWMATDGSGNTASCSMIITVNDAENPTIVCPANIIAGSDPGQCSAVVSYLNPVGMDNCPGATTLQTGGLGSGGTFPYGISTETFTVTDGMGLTANCSFTITVVDSGSPVIVCPADTVVTPDAGQTYATYSYNAPQATDNCGTVNVVQTGGLASGSQFPGGSTYNIFVATDPAGNADTCLFEVKVVDTADVTPPVIVCPGNLAAVNDAGICGATMTFIAPIGTDNFPGAVTTQITGLPSGSVFPVGVTTNTFVVTDAAGNTDTCSFTITITDNENPVAVCQDVTIFLDGNGNYTLTPQEVDNGSTDNCGIDTMYVSPNSFNCGNLPGGAVPADLFISEYVEGTANNKCLEIFNGTGLPVDLGAGGYAIRVYYNGATTYTNFPLNGVIADGDVFVFCHNKAPAATLAIADQTTNLAIWTGDDAVVLAKSGQILDIIGRIGEDPGSAWSVSGKLTLNQTLIRHSNITSGVVVNPSLGFPTLDLEWSNLPMDDISNLGMHSFVSAGGSTVTLTVKDAAGNMATCTANRIVRDTLPPVIECQPVTVSLDQNGQGIIQTQDVLVSVSDNCGMDTTFLDQYTFGCENLGSGGVTPTELFISEYIEGNGNVKCLEIYNGTGAAINLATAGYAIRVYFNGASTFSNFPLTGTVADGDVYVFCHQGAGNLALAQSDQIQSGALWNGDDAVVLVKGSTIVDIFGRIGEDPGSAWVDAGNQTANQTLVRVPGVVAGIAVNPSVGFPTLGAEWSRLPVSNTSDLGMHTFSPLQTGNAVTLTAVDANYNVSHCTVNVTVLPNCSVSFDSCMQDIIITCPLSNDSTEVVFWTEPTATANCPEACSVSVAQIAGPPSGSILEEGTITTVTYVATSGSNSDTCSFDIVIPACPPARVAAQGSSAEQSEQEAVETQAAVQDNVSAELVDKPVVVFPNPFRESVTFRFILSEPAPVELVIMDMNGKVLRKFASDQLDAGTQHWIWDATDDSGNALVSGIYLYRLRMGDRVEFGKVEYVR